jgi:hypothetical protein
MKQGLPCHYIMPWGTIGPCSVATGAARPSALPLAKRGKHLVGGCGLRPFQSSRLRRPVACCRSADTDRVLGSRRRAMQRRKFS